MRGSWGRRGLHPGRRHHILRGFTLHPRRSCFLGRLVGGLLVGRTLIKGRLQFGLFAGWRDMMYRCCVRGRWSSYIGWFGSKLRCWGFSNWGIIHRSWGGRMIGRGWGRVIDGSGGRRLVHGSRSRGVIDWGSSRSRGVINLKRGILTSKSRRL
uniref:Uncharacterized protein n=1 Tax=Cacopsylla melanoneura TaxID=428564 RepID=A0A8D8UFI8_9HEMI